MAAKKCRDAAGVPLDDDLLDAIYDAVGDERRWKGALAQIASWIGASGAMYCLLVANPPKPGIRSLHSSGYAEGADAAYVQTGHCADPHMPLGIATPISNWFFGQDHFSDRFVAEDPFFQETLRPLGIRWVAGSRLWEGVGETACLAFQKPPDEAPFSASERMQLDALAPHMRRMSQLHERLAADGAHAQLGLEAMNRLSIGIAVLTAGGRILYSNASADQVFRRRTVFDAPVCDRIAPRDSRCQRAFARAIREAAETKNSTSLTLVDEHGMPVARATAMPMPATSRWNANWQQPLAMLAIHPVRTPQVNAATLRSLFDLSAAESRLANALLTGRTTRSYAEERKLSIETVRTQLKSVLAKTDTCSQSQLVATLMALPATFLAPP
jgi:DNA-binding CsgD family transcriptional regulator